MSFFEKVIRRYLLANYSSLFRTYQAVSYRATVGMKHARMRINRWNMLGKRGEEVSRSLPRFYGEQISGQAVQFRDTDFSTAGIDGSIIPLSLSKPHYRLWPSVPYRSTAPNRTLILCAFQANRRADTPLPLCP